jgi:hypothetical protein
MDRPRDEAAGGLPAEAMSRFRDAEARLYPMALADPVGYEVVASLIGLVADELRRSSSDISSVLERRPALIGLVPRLAERAGLIGDLLPADLPADAVVDAASAVRCRELAGIRYTERGPSDA